MKVLMLVGLVIYVTATASSSTAVSSASLLAVNFGSTSCTAAKLRGNFVLTASHCAPGASFPVTVGQTRNTNDHEPGSVVANDPLLLLAVVCSPVEGTPLELASAGPSSGNPVTIGVDLAPTPSTVSTVAADRLYVNPIPVSSAPCSGDSGGPAVNANDQIVGVLDKVVGTCGEARGTYVTVYTSAEKAFIEGAMSSARVKACDDWVRYSIAFKKFLLPPQK